MNSHIDALLALSERRSDVLRQGLLDAISTAHDGNLSGHLGVLSSLQPTMRELAAILDVLVLLARNK